MTGGCLARLALALVLAATVAACGRPSRPVPPEGAVSYRIPVQTGPISPSQTTTSGSSNKGILYLPTPEEVIAPDKPPYPGTSSQQ